MQQFQGLIGLAAILLLAWAFSEDRANRPGRRWLGGALLLQLAIAVIVDSLARQSRASHGRA